MAPRHSSTYRDVCRGRALMDAPIPISPRPTGRSSTFHKYGITTPGLGLGNLDMWTEEKCFTLKEVSLKTVKTLFRCFATQLQDTDYSVFPPSGKLIWYFGHRDSSQLKLLCSRSIMYVHHGYSIVSPFRGRRRDVPRQHHFPPQREKEWCEEEPKWGGSENSHPKP